MYQIINVPINYTAQRGGKVKYPFEHMDVGQSFIIPADRAPKWRSAQQVAWRAGAIMDRAFRAVLLPNGDIQIGRIS
jgi:hypothetical protein